MAQKADPFNNKRIWNDWKKTKVLKTRDHKKISDSNKQLIIEYLEDMESGNNVERSGKRSYIRLNTLRQRITWLIANMGFEDITEIERKEVLDFFKRMEDGEIARKDGKKFKSINDYINIFKAFWHWYQKKELEKEHVVKDVTKYLNNKPVDREFVYFTMDDFKKVVKWAKYDYHIYLWVLMDSGIRSPTEFQSLLNSDFHYNDDEGCYELDIKEAYSKTFGRRIKLILCSDLLKEYLKDKDPEKPFLQKDWKTFTLYMKRLFIKHLGDKKTKGGKYVKEIRPYDLRHCSACYWLPRYKNESALKYRFGWQKENMIHYYTKFLGMRDTITSEDLLLNSEAKSKIEKDLEIERKQRQILQDQLTEQTKVIESLKETLDGVGTHRDNIYADWQNERTSMKEQLLQEIRNELFKNQKKATALKLE